MKIIWKLLRAHVSFSQMIGFFLANLVGMVIVLLCVQIYMDIRPVFAEGDSFIKKDYLVVTKKVSTMGMVAGQSAVFTEKERQEIAGQSFIKNMGEFTSSAYQVTAGINIMNRGFSTEMFFESVPDEYVDVKGDDWYFDEKEGTIPIIIPRNYLNLYNFGFAQARGLPRISEGIINILRLDVELRGNGERAAYKGKIAGFSNRLNTILVPEQFMEWANQTFAPGKKAEPSRLILETANPSDKQLVDFMTQKGYEVEGGKLDSGKAIWFLNVLTGVVITIGLLICLLSVYILMLSIYLILQKNSTKLENLLLLGYSVNQVAVPYQRLSFMLNGTVLLVSFLVIGIIRLTYISWLHEIWPEFEASGIWMALLTGVLLLVTVGLVNVWAIRKKIRNISRGK